jgi:carboxylesterase type B
MQDAQPLEPWVGVRDATKDGNQCYARDLLSFSRTVQGSEDCLFSMFTHNNFHRTQAKP